MTRTLAALAAFFLLLSVAVGVFTPSLNPVVIPPTPLASPVVYAKVLDKDGKELGHGTAFYIGNGQFVTAGHVAEAVTADNSLELDSSITGMNFKARVVWIDKSNDIALLSAEHTQGSVRAVAKFCKLPDVRVGDVVVSIGYPLSLGLVKTVGRVATPVHTLSEDQAGEGGRTVFIANLVIAPGNSGGPVIDSNGYVAGFADAIALVPLGFGASLTSLSMIVPRSAICADIAAGVVN